MGFEIMEQLDWEIPKHTVVCMASGSLLTKIHKSYQEFTKLGLVKNRDYAIHGAQATGLFPDHHRAEGRARFLQAGQARHHRQIPGDRHAGRRVLRLAVHEADRRITATT